MVACGLLIASFLYLLIRVILRKNAEGKRSAWAIFLFLTVGGTAVALACAYVRYLLCLDVPAAAAGILFAVVLMFALPKAVAFDRRLMIGLAAILLACGGGLWEAREAGRSCLEAHHAARDEARRLETEQLRRSVGDSVLRAERARNDSAVATAWTVARRVRYEDSYNAKTGSYDSLVVETNAVFSRDSVRPLQAGPLSEALLPLVKDHTDAHERILDAALGCDFEPAFEAFMKDPLVIGRVNMEDGRALLTEMIRNTLRYLPEAWQSLR